MLTASFATPAFADTPETWQDPAPVSPLHAILLLGGVPLALMVVITLLVYAPSWAKGGDEYTPGQAWRGEREWFGGPRSGIETAEQAELEPGQSETGGASAHW